MDNYRYILDKSSKKFICPRCQKKRFVKFIDTTNGNYLADEFGRCDRQNGCAYFVIPPKEKRYYLINFLSISTISKKAVKAIDQDAVIYFIPKSLILEQEDENLWLPEWYLEKENIYHLGNQEKVITDDSIVNIISKAPPQPKIITSYHSLELLNDFYNEKEVEDNLSIFLKRLFDRKDYFKAKQNYFITGTDLKWKQSTIFWQIDEDEKIRCAKVMLYDPENGKRVKEPYSHINWLHSELGLKDFNIDQCLFGLHLLAEYPEKDVAIVESEKTAIIMSIVMPEFIWMATGGAGNLNLNKLKSLKNRKIILYPDKGEFEKWQKVEIEGKESNYKISTSNFLETTELSNGMDLADFYLNSSINIQKC